MTEEIIIDKENKTKKHRNNEIDCLHFGCRKGENGNVLFWCDFYDDYCDNYTGCYYRKYLRLEQERDELKKTVENQKLEYEELQCDLSEVENACGCYQSENAKLKQENKELRKANEISIEKVTVTAEAKRLQELEQENKDLKALNKKIKVYWNALEEIREIVTSAFAKQRPYKEDFAEIETKINEVLNL